MKAFFTDPAFIAAVKRFGKVVVATGITAAAGAVLLALKADPNASASFVADAATTGFITGVILACEKFLNFEPATTDAPTAPTAPTTPTK